MSEEKKENIECKTVFVNEDELLTLTNAQLLERYKMLQDAHRTINAAIGQMKSDLHEKRGELERLQEFAREQVEQASEAMQKNFQLLDEVEKLRITIIELAKANAAEFFPINSNSDGS